MFFGIPDTGSDDIDDPGHWAQILGFCDALQATGRAAGMTTARPECQKAQARNRPCGFSHGPVAVAALDAQQRAGVELDGSLGRSA